MQTRKWEKPEGSNKIKRECGVTFREEKKKRKGQLVGNVEEESGGEKFRRRVATRGLIVREKKSGISKGGNHGKIVDGAV